MQPEKEQDKFEQIASRHSDRQPTVNADKGRLGIAVGSYLDRRDKRLRKNALVVKAWKRLLPKELYDHCTIAGISPEILRVAVEPGPYMHEMQLLSQELLEQLRSQCRGCGITKIKLLPGINTSGRNQTKDDRP